MTISSAAFDDVFFEHASEEELTLALNEGILTDIQQFAQFALTRMMSVFSSDNDQPSKKIASDYTMKMKADRAKLEAAGVDVKAIDQAAKDLQEKIGKQSSILSESTVLTEGYKEEAADYIRKTFFQSFIDAYTGITKNVEGELTTGLALLAIVMLVNSLAVALLTAILIPAVGAAQGPMIAMVITACAVAPFTEEYARHEALRRGEGIHGFLLGINVFEFMSYTRKIVAAGGSLVGAVILRLLAAGMHQTVTTIQKRFWSQDIVDGKRKDEAGKSGFLTAVAIHMAWNIIGVVFSKGINRAIGIKESVDIVDIHYELELV